MTTPFKGCVCRVADTQIWPQKHFTICRHLSPCRHRYNNHPQLAEFPYLQDWFLHEEKLYPVLSVCFHWFPPFTIYHVSPYSTLNCFFLRSVTNLCARQKLIWRKFSERFWRIERESKKNLV